MLADPVVAYQGGVPGLAATKPARGKKIDPASSEVVHYVGYLEADHDEALRRIGGGQKLYDYVYAYNGVAAKLTSEQAAALQRQPGVLTVTPDELETAETSTTPSFLGLDAPGGLWDQLGGGGAGGKNSSGPGENIIIGDIDSGIWPEKRNFADRDADGRLIYQEIPGWHGRCVPGEEFNASMCNQKLIGARWFNAAWGGDEALEAERPWEFMSARDYHGHGTATASTAAGNHRTPTTGAFSAFGPNNGMAPRARIAVYKAVWSTEDASDVRGFRSDLVAAIDQAVADGVDVINYSISGTLTNFLDPAEVAFLSAADAGIFVSAAAANNGPTASTVNHPSPWVTTVAAGTHNRRMLGTVTLGDGSSYGGASAATSAVGPGPVVLATASGLPGADPNLLRQCFSTPAQLDPAVVTGKIVVCQRGGAGPLNPRLDKSRAVENAGGVGVIIYNVSPNSLDADLHSLPTTHLDNVAGPAVVSYVTGAGASATAMISRGAPDLSVPAPFTTSFSSRGPLLAGGGDLLKPDVIAPGLDVLAPTTPAPPGDFYRLGFGLWFGTSFSTPHVAGVAALVKDLHPNWTPMMIKSALMTTGYDVLDGGIGDATRIFRQGAGHIRPSSAMDPGLVYDSSLDDWLAFLCGTTTGVPAATCNALEGLGYSLDPSDLNVPSIAIGDLAGVQTVTRKVTNVGGSTATYTSSVSGMSGVTVDVDPSTVTIDPGQSKTFTVTFIRTAAPVNEYGGGQLTWTQSAGPHVVRIPMVVKPIALAAPTEVSGHGGTIQYEVKFGYTGAFAATARGLVAATADAGTVEDDPGDSFSPGGPGTTSFSVVVPGGTTYARFSLFDENVSPASDLDVYVFRGTTLVGSSGGTTAAEEVDLVDPPPATYTVWVHGFSVPTGQTASFTLFDWALGSSAAGNMAVTAPGSAIFGTRQAISLTFTSLAAATSYLGSVAYDGVAGLPSPTIVRVDTP